MTKEDFCKVWKDSTKEEILNQYYYDYTELKETIDKAIEYIKFNLDKNEELIEYFNWDGNFNKLLKILKDK